MYLIEITSSVVLFDIEIIAFVKEETNRCVETDRLILRKFTGEDWKDLFEYLSSEAVVKFERYITLTEEACKQEAVYRSKNDAFWAVCLKANIN